MGSIVGSLLSIYGFSKIEISEATLFSYLKPFVYIPLAVLWLHESIDMTQIIGLATILIGLMIAEIRKPSNWFTKFFKRSHHHHQQSYHLRH
jgi:drug/metabolite transporter (DMT)-like permease